MLRSHGVDFTFLALTPSETGLEQSQREGRHRSLRAGTAEKDHCVRVSPLGGYIYIRAALGISIPSSFPGPF